MVTEPRGDCTSAGGLGPGNQVLCGYGKPDLLLSVEYDELLPHCLQTLLQVSILSKSTERVLIGRARDRGISQRDTMGDWFVLMGVVATLDLETRAVTRSSNHVCRQMCF